MTRPAIAVLLEAARKGLDRVQATDLESEIAVGALVVDTRPIEQRRRDGDLPGALIIDRKFSSGDLTPPARITSQRLLIPAVASSSSATRATAPAWQPPRCANSALPVPPISWEVSRRGNDFHVWTLNLKTAGRAAALRLSTKVLDWLGWMSASASGLRNQNGWEVRWRPALP